MVVKGVLVNNYNVDWNDKMVRVYEMGSACLKYIFFLHYVKPVMLYSVSWLLFCCYKTRSGREQKSFYQKGLTWKAPCLMNQIQILGILLLTFNRLINLVVMLNSWKNELCFHKNNRNNSFHFQLIISLTLLICQNIWYRFIPFSGGPRKCVGDQFALLEAIVALAILLQNMNFELVPDQNINMTTGATIHTTNVRPGISLTQELRWYANRIRVLIPNIIVFSCSVNDIMWTRIVMYNLANLLWTMISVSFKSESKKPYVSSFRNNTHHAVLKDMRDRINSVFN